ncbi:indolepyruvate oxidoreductase subunit beta [bacterium]|nr:MAG: indolepyruvate oxidoreductase subunit beta [bacterium]RKZ24128.1 MAG: indolepyruvate oxidoreductase subunit beta [bacterium]
MTKSIVICGVGGQGILVASDILSLAAMYSGFDAKKSEVHGMSQRGGDVISTVRYGEKVYSPLIGEGMADIILGFEKLEVLRNLSLLKPDGKVIVTDTRLDPLPVACGLDEYPDDVIGWIKKNVSDVHVVDAVKVAVELGNIRVTNVVMLGALSGHIPEIKKEAWEQAIRERVPQKYVDLNLTAFERGCNIS